MHSESDTVFVNLRISNEQNWSLTKSAEGWSTAKLLLVGLIALCILGIILAAIFFVISKKFKKNQRTTTTTTGSTTTTKAAVTKGISPDPKYQPVPNV